MDNMEGSALLGFTEICDCLDNGFVRTLTYYHGRGERPTRVEIYTKKRTSGSVKPPVLLSPSPIFGVIEGFDHSVLITGGFDHSSLTN